MSYDMFFLNDLSWSKQLAIFCGMSFCKILPPPYNCFNNTIKH